MLEKISFVSENFLFVGTIFSSADKILFFILNLKESGRYYLHFEKNFIRFFEVPYVINFFPFSFQLWRYIF